MTDTISNEDAAEIAAPRVVFPTKTATVTKLLARNRGATIAEIMAVTSWQPHSVRAFLTGLRNKGSVLLKEERKGGDNSYRLSA